ncbi:unnamed protein product [Closterium sp. NIES-53]
MAAQELRWLTYLLTDLGEQPRSPPVLYVDNKAMLALCREHRLEHRTKHIALRYFLARELQQRGQLRLAYVASEANTADIFTKALAPGDHQRFCTLLEQVDPHGSILWMGPPIASAAATLSIARPRRALPACRAPRARANFSSRCALRARDGFFCLPAHRAPRWRATEPCPSCAPRRAAGFVACRDVLGARCGPVPDLPRPRLCHGPTAAAVAEGGGRVAAVKPAAPVARETIAPVAREPVAPVAREPVAPVARGSVAPASKS